MARPTLLRRRSRREWLAAGLVFGGLLAFVLLVYGGVVIVGGSLLGLGRADIALSVVATAAVALGFDRAQSWLELVASKVVHGGMPSPYDVLRGFSGTVVGRYSAEKLPSLMAQVLAEGTGVEWSQVWLVVGGRPTLAATWPPGSTRPADAAEDDPRDAEAPGRRSLAVRHDNELLGVLVVQERAGVPLTSTEERLFAELADQSRPVLRGARLRAELEERAVELSARADELRLSRQRLVDTQDHERRLLERDIHDGAQQHLVALAVNLRLSETLAQRSAARAVAVLDGQELAALEAVDALVRLAHGIYPSQLVDHGLAAALRAATASSPVPVAVDAVGLHRFPARVETAAYFCCLEALQNAVKHSGAPSVELALRAVDTGSLEFAVVDHGAGFDSTAAASGSGLTNMRDRLDAVGGVLTVTSTPTEGTRVVGRIPGGRS